MGASTTLTGIKTALAGWARRLIALSRREKRLFLVTVDLLLLTSALWMVLGIRRNTLFYVPPTWTEAALLLAAPILTVSTFGYFGLYKFVTRYMGSRGTTRLVLCVVLAVLLWSLLVFMSGQNNVPRTVILGYAAGAALAVWASRKAAASYLRSVGVKVRPVKRELKPVLIYGAGAAGQALSQALGNTDYNVIAFIDHDPSLWGQYVGDHKVHSPTKLDRFIERESVAEVLLTVPADRRQERRDILRELEGKPVAVRIMPGMDEIASGRVAMTDLRPVDAADLLGRDPVPPFQELLTRNIEGKSILVTGAGGSVGSELVRQILRWSPKRLVLLDVSEFMLFEIETEVRETLAAAARAAEARAAAGPDAATRPGTAPSKPPGPAPEVFAVLGSVLDPTLVTETLRRYGIDTIYHAAAYKHVPIVEHNPVVGLTNNTFGTAVVAEAARAAGVERMVLISTDKAVRPTNIMGASKRLAELVLQAHAAEGGGTVFTMVRFGNVLGSSGSVVRRFRSQINAGGPVTVTHPDINRFFMSIPEAAELVIQAGAMARGGDVFVLDMGEPVKIIDLARLMIRLSGLEVRDEQNPEGDIAIDFIGLRPGEKLYEELLIGSSPEVTATEHPRILRASEPSLPTSRLKVELDALRAAMLARDIDAIHALLTRTVEGYQPDKRASADLVARTTWGNASRTLH